MLLALLQTSFRPSLSLVLALIFLFAVPTPFADHPRTFLDSMRENSIFTFLSPTALDPRLAALLSSLQALLSSASWQTLSLPQLRHIISLVPGAVSLDLRLTRSVISASATRAARTGIPALLGSTKSLYDTVHSIVYPPVRQGTKDDALTQFYQSLSRLPGILLTTIELVSLAVHSLFVLDRWVKSRDGALATIIAAGAECEWDYCTNARQFAAMLMVVGFLGFAPVWMLMWWAVEYVSEARRYLQLAAQDEESGGRGGRADLKRGEELLDAARKDREEGKEMEELSRKKNE